MWAWLMNWIPIDYVAQSRLSEVIEKICSKCIFGEYLTSIFLMPQASVTIVSRKRISRFDLSPELVSLSQ